MITSLRRSFSPIQFLFLGVLLAIFITITTSGIAVAADGTLPQMPDLLSGTYCITSGRVALRYAERRTANLDVDGQPVPVYLFWSARDKKPDRADRELALTIDSGTPI